MNWRMAEEELTFEEAVSRLESTLRRLEEGGLTLDEAVSLYEEGMRLARVCNVRLDSAELRITQISTVLEESQEEEPF